MSEQMRDPAWVNAVRDRVLAEIAANPSQKPYLTLPKQPRRALSDEEREARRERARSQQRRYSRPAARAAEGGA